MAWNGLAWHAEQWHHSVMAVVGDRVQIASRKVGEAPRAGVVTGVSGTLLRVRWATGEESTVVPSMGSLEITGKQAGGLGRTRQAKGASTGKRRSNS